MQQATTQWPAATAFQLTDQRDPEALLIYQDDGALLFSNRVADKLCQTPPATRHDLEARYTLHTLDGQVVPEQFDSFWQLAIGDESDPLECLVVDAQTGDRLECRLRGACVAAEGRRLHLLFLVTMMPLANWLHGLVAANPLPALLVNPQTLEIVSYNAPFMPFSGVQAPVEHLSAIPGLKPVSELLTATAEGADPAYHTLTLRLAGSIRVVNVALSHLIVARKALCYLVFSEAPHEPISAADLKRAIALTLAEAPRLSRQILDQLQRVEAGATTTQRLTEREMDILDGLARGDANQAIAERLALSGATVKNYIVRIYRKLGVHSRAEAIIWARERGFGLR